MKVYQNKQETSLLNRKELKEKYIHIRIEESFKQELTQRTKEAGLTISTLVNMLLRQWLKQQS